MRLVMTLLVRNEEDIVAANLDYHLSRGVDFVIATDNLSTDGTTEILKRYERAGVVRYLFEPLDDYSQDLWVTRMAQLATTEHAADWIIHVDADEFWWPEEDGSLKAPLQRVDEAVDGVYVRRSNFVAMASSSPGVPFHRTMQYRERCSRTPDGKRLPGKVAHRAFRGVTVHQGNHGFTLHGQTPRIVQSSDFLIFHFPLRDAAQFSRKIAQGGAAYARNTRLPRQAGREWRRLYELEMLGELAAYVERQQLDEATAHRMQATGDLIHDARLDRYLTCLVRPCPVARLAEDTRH